MRINIGDKSINRSGDPDYLKDYIYDDYRPNKGSYYQPKNNKGGDFKWLYQLLVSALILLAFFGVYRTNMPFANTVRNGLSNLMKKETNLQPVLHTILQLASQSGNLDWPMIDDVPITKEVSVNKEPVPNTKPVAVAEPLYILPLSGKVVRNFGWIKEEGQEVAAFNGGIDIEAAEGNSEVRASSRGEVIKVGEDEKLGKYIIIRQNSEILMRYSNLSDVEVKVGDNVETGDVISHVKGLSKKGEKSILHFEIVVSGNPVNPMDKFLGDKAKQ